MGRWGAVLFGAVATAVWSAAQVLQAAHWPTPAIVAFNVCSQSAAFAFVGWAVLSMREMV